jgi:hypothetical protein
VAGRRGSAVTHPRGRAALAARAGPRTAAPTASTVLEDHAGAAALAVLGSAALRAAVLVDRVGVAGQGSVGPRVPTVLAERVGPAGRGDARARRPAT